ncbi:MAG TPA: LemA family protein [Armatimonadota bacterium]|jgi:LemA protein
MDTQDTGYAASRPKKGCAVGCIALAVLGLIALSVYGSFKGAYNTLVKQDQQVKSAWAQVDNNLQRRSDLIPQLMGVVKGVAGHEEKVFGRIADARSRVNAAGPGPSPQKARASQDLSNAVNTAINSVVEAYPELKSNDSFLTLQDSVEGSENRLAHSREQYNNAVRSYNETAKSFPMTLFIGMTPFPREKPYFEAPADSRERPSTEFPK